ncbi:hypothetical protein GCM10012285_47430 [Streptomyces kronopolitis]|uniref:Uncharacterized protein n=1 Tax=Streptomyces kronopolitis TaxID=1612435 RepID=A0ABQ2JV87_9ACTN|nr:hypothetical protein [Streptomyces kronopolitis]GGN54527.1 hypothetical protein GCM10012285_47430 [Streptomyces kronopolitis]
MTPPARPRLLPWSSPEGKPCYLLSEGDGPVTRQADAVERAQLASGRILLGHARALLHDDRTTAPELRFLAVCLTDTLADTLRVAHSRGGRLDCEPPEFTDGEPRPLLDTAPPRDT